MVFGEASIIGDFGESVFKDGAGERFDLGESDGLPSEGMPGDAGCFHAGADGEISDGFSDGFGLCGFIHLRGL